VVETRSAPAGPLRTGQSLKGFPMQWWFVGAAALAGCFIAIQAAANSALRDSLASPWYAAFFSITGTMACAILFLVCTRPPVPTTSMLRDGAWWSWIGGPLGAAFVLSGTLLVPRLGTATFLAAVVAGQLACSLAIDHYGLMNITQHPISLGRLLGAALVLRGFLL